MNKTAFGLIDAQRGFMPAEEGERLGVPGFGELPIAEGEEIVIPVNRLLKEFKDRQLPVFYTQDWHPRDTAHFAEEPNYQTTWPVHCVGGTPGAQLHPEIEVGDGLRQFVKGTEQLKRGEDDTSYSGMNGYDETYGQRPAEFLAVRNVTEIILGGLALDYCVKATALDIRQKLNLDVTIAVDATRAVAEETARQAVKEMEAAGVRFATTEELLERIAATAA